MIYDFKGRAWPVSAQIVGEELEKIRTEQDGILEPRHVVDAARPAYSPLHACFGGWDDAEDAQKWREHTARHLIASIVEVHQKDDGEKRSTIAYVHVPQPDNGQGYARTVEVMSDEEMWARVMARELAVLRGVQARVAGFKEFDPVVKAIDKVAAKIERKKKPVTV